VISTNTNGGSFKIFELSDIDDMSSAAASSVQVQSLGTAPSSSPNQSKIVSALRSTFLPTGFPQRTPPGYLRYSVWSWVQDLSTQLRSVLATQRILEGVGVGREGATAISALFNYLVRDGFGMAATLLFTYAASSRFRTDCKRWRIFADVSVDVGITLEVTATLLPSAFFLPMICMGNVFKALCGVAAGACGGSINLHWAKGSDISDINAKFGSQHTVTAALGLIFAGIFAQSMNRVSSHSLWTLYFLLTTLHIFANLRCMRLISFDYLNTNRMDMLLDQYFSSDGLSSTLSSPQDIAKKESLWFIIPEVRQILTRGPKSISPKLCFGVAFDELCQNSSTSDKTGSDWRIKFNRASTSTVRDEYLISTGYPTSNNAVPCISVSLLSDATPLQQTKAYFHSKLLSMRLQEQMQSDSRKSLTDIEVEIEKSLDATWQDFVQKSTEVGWDLNRSELQTRGYEISVDTSELS
jgi:hypothetical protein